MSSLKINPETIVAEAEELVKAREALHADAVNTESALLQRLEEGDETVTADDLTTAANEKRRAELLLAAAKKSLAQAQREASHIRAVANPEVADLVATLLTENLLGLGLYGVPISVVADLPSDIAERVPSVFVIQSQAAKHDVITGLADGSCDVVFAYNIADPIDITKVRFALEQIRNSDKRLTSVETYKNRPTKIINDDVEAKPIAVHIRGLKPEVPTIVGDPQPWRLNQFTEVIANEVHKAIGRYGRKGVQAGSGGFANSSVSLAKVNVFNLRIVDSEDINEILTTTYECRIAAQLPPSAVGHGTIADALHKAVAEMNDKFVSAVGRVVSAELFDLGPAQYGRTCSVRLKVVRRKP